jgi:hypothetical protein
MKHQSAPPVVANGGAFRRRIARVLCAFSGALAFLALAPSPAQAGAFAVTSCSEGANAVDSGAYVGRQSSGRMVIKRACNIFRRGRTGMITANRVRRGRVRRGEYARLVMTAPPGTVLTGIRWSGSARRSDCGWALEMFGARPRQRARYIANLPAAGRCRLSGSARAAGRPRPRSYSLGASTRIEQRVVCRARRGCSTSRLTSLETYQSKVTVVDVSRPLIRITGGGLASRRWVRGTSDVRFAAYDNVGISGEALLVGGYARTSRLRRCDGSRTVPCPNGPGGLAFDTARAPDGVHPASVFLRDSAGNVAAAGFTAYLDNSPPGRVNVVLEGGQGWRRTNSFAARWGNPRERFAPIAGAHYVLCRTGTASCLTAHRSRPGLSSLPGLAVPGPGDWSLALWRFDSAGNSNRAVASVPVRLRFDPEPPRPAFEPPTLSDPTRVALLVSDRVSGLARGEIELRRVGTSTWQSLDVRREGSRLIGKIDDSRLPAGQYELRGRAFDQAGNEASTLRRIDGSPASLTLPLRFPSVLTGGIERRRVVRRVIRQRGKRRRVRRRVVQLVPTRRVTLGRQTGIRGRLTNVDGQPIGGAQIFVLSEVAGGPRALTGVVTTGPDGSWTYTARASQSRVLRFAYLGTSLILPSELQTSLLVPASSSLGVNRRRARNGGSVVFRGRMRSLPLPVTGKLVEMQAFFRGRWRTFSTVRTNKEGRWRFRYRFGGTVGRVRYRFRARLPAEAGYPFETGASRVVSVTVRGPGR